MPYYRIDWRPFEINDLIIPNNEFIRRINERQIAVEEILEQFRPDNKPDRNQILKIFGDFDSAKLYWLNEQETKFYEVEIDENNILHKGDYNLVQQIYNTENIDIRREFARKYWEELTIIPNTIEYFVYNARVRTIICNDEAVRINSHRARLHFDTDPRIRII